MPIKLIIRRIQKIYSYRRSLWGMSLKQFRAKYAGSLLGLFWVIINPLLMVLVITFVFTAVFRTEVKDFALFILSGILPWMFFSAALSESTPSLLAQRSVLHQFSLPKEILPLSSILSFFMNFLISWCIVYPVFFLRDPRILPASLLLPVIFLLTYFFTCGIGLLFSAINIIFRDLEHLLGILLMFWFWVTPVFYSIEMVPDQFRWVFNLNPVSPFILCYREIVFYGRMPDAAVFLVIISLAFSSLFLGLTVSVWLESRILKRI